MAARLEVNVLEEHIVSMLGDFGVYPPSWKSKRDNADMLAGKLLGE